MTQLLICLRLPLLCLTLLPPTPTASKEEARKALREGRANADAGLAFDVGNLTVGEYLDRWLADSVMATVRQRTYERYESIVRVHLKPSIGRLKLKALTPAHARALYRQKLDSGLAPRTVNIYPRTRSTRRSLRP